MTQLVSLELHAKLALGAGLPVSEVIQANKENIELFIAFANMLKRAEGDAYEDGCREGWETGYKDGFEAGTDDCKGYY